MTEYEERKELDRKDGIRHWDAMDRINNLGKYRKNKPSSDPILVLADVDCSKK